MDFTVGVRAKIVARSIGIGQSEKRRESLHRLTNSVLGANTQNQNHSNKSVESSQSLVSLHSSDRETRTNQVLTDGSAKL